MPRTEHHAGRGGRSRAAALPMLLAALLAGCGGGTDTATETSDTGATPQAAARAAAAGTGAAQAAAGAVTVTGNGSSLAAIPEKFRLDATRLAQQATFGPTEALVQEIRTTTPAKWVAAQMALSTSRYRSGQTDAIDKHTSSTSFCELPANSGPNCWRDWYSSEPLLWDFYRNAVSQPDQLRQRVAFALGQIVVVSNVEVSGTYGFRYYHNMLLDQAFGNWRELLRRVVRSPLMGDYLNHVNNDKLLPNENFARELLQLFSVGPCLLQRDGTLTGGRCTAVYGNDTVREYAYALTGWTYPAGGSTPWGCWPTGANCPYLGGDMVPAPTFRDTAARTLLSGITVSANASATGALDRVLDSLMAHPNMGPFVGSRFIRHLVKSNPSPQYVSRVAAAFDAGRFTSDGITFGTGQKGDLAATVAAVLLDTEARDLPSWENARGGHLREPALMMAGVLRALNGTTDGDALSWWWGSLLRQHVFRSPTVFNFYPADYPVAGTTLLGGEFGIHNANTALERLNYLTYLLEWGGSDPDPSRPDAVGTRVDLAPFRSLASTPDKLVDNLSLLAIGRVLAPTPRAKVLEAVNWWTSKNAPTTWQDERVATAAFLVFASPDYQIQR